MPLLKVSVGCDEGARTLYRDERGQGTVEYALVVFALLAIILACGALWKTFEAGVFVEHAVASASHNLSSASPGALVDVFLY